MHQKSKLLVMLSAIGFSTVIFTTGCKKDDGPSVVKVWENVAVKAIYEVYDDETLAGRTDEGTATLTLRSDNSLAFTLHLHTLKAGDVLTAAHIHYGNAASNGDVIVNLAPVFSGAAASGTVQNLRAGQVDTLLNKPVYLNIHSSQAPGGVVRAQLDKTVVMAANVALNGANEVPAFTTTTTGKSILRLTSDNVLYSKVTVTNIQAGDALTAAHIHKGAAGTNGDVLVFLCSSAADFGKVQVSSALSSTVVQSLKNDPLYVNVHSSLNAGAGTVRGQIR